MKKLCIWLGLALVIIGLVAVAVTWVLGAQSEKYEMLTYTADGAVNTLDIELDAGEIDVGYSDVTEAMVVYPQGRTHRFEVTLDGGTLSYRTVSHRVFWGFGQNSIPKATVLLPAGSKVALKLKLNAGVLNVGSGEFGDVSVEVNAGKVDLGDTACSSLVGTVNAGELSVAFVDTASASLEVNAGRIGAVFAGKAADYAISAHTDLGSCTVNDSQGTPSSSKSLRVNVNVGQCNVSFRSVEEAQG